MKIIAIIIFTLVFSQFVNALQTCKTYITDEWPNTRYTIADISGDNVVTDNKTGLMWKQCSEGLTGTNCSAGPLVAHKWNNALDLASNEDFAGFTDWRVPNEKELQTIVARNCYSPSINVNVFPNTPNDVFWSSSPHVYITNYTWVVNFGVGSDKGNYRGYNTYVRLVRGLGQ